MDLHKNMLSHAFCANFFSRDSKVQCTVYKQIEHVFALQKLSEMQASNLQTQVFFLLVGSSFSSFVSRTNIAKS